MHLQITVAPLMAPSEAMPNPPPALFVDGVLVRGLKAFVAQGGDVLLVLDQANVRVDPRIALRPIAERT